jgi:phosphate transport system permease protein
LRLSALSSLPQNAAKNKAPGKKNFDRLYALPRYYGYTTMLWSIVPTIFIGYVIINHYPLKNQYIPAFLSESIVTYLGLFLLFLICSLFLIKSSFNAQKHIEGWIKKLLILSTLISVSITALIFFSVLFESIRFFEKVNFFDFLFGLEWSPQTAIRADQAGGSGSFGIIPVFLGTLLITFVAMFVAAPLGLMSAIYLSEYSSDRFRMYVKPILEILAGIPTVVYGYFAAVTFGPFVRDIFESFGFDVASESAFAAGFVMGIMIIPYMMSLTDDVMNAVPKSLRDASLGLGATKSETIVKVVIPAALPGIMGAFLLAVSRAIGETMIVTMAAGLIAKLTLNPFDSVTTVTAQIVKLLVGDQEFDSAKTLAAFALSLTLFIITLLLNVLALMIVKKYRERYE